MRCKPCRKVVACELDYATQLPAKMEGAAFGSRCAIPALAFAGNMPNVCLSRSLAPKKQKAPGLVCGSAGELFRSTKEQYGFAALRLPDGTRPAFLSSFPRRLRPNRPQSQL